MSPDHPTYAKLQAFANKHKLILQDRGAVGFGRACVGFETGAAYVDYNPQRRLEVSPYYEDVWPRDRRLDPPADKTPNAYHKHDCLAVLIDRKHPIPEGGSEDYSDEAYDEALEELLAWVEHLEAQGELHIVDFETGASGLQAVLTGAFGKAIRFVEEA